MKKLFLGAAIAASSLTFAQQFGLKAGVNVSSLSKHGDVTDAKSKVGFNAGVFANFPIATNFSIQPEVLFNQAGDKEVREYSLSTLGTNNSYKATYKNDYSFLSVPVMFQYNATPEFYLEAGPQFSFLMAAKSKGDVVMNGTTTSAYDYDVKSALNTFDFGLGIGAGYYFIPNLGVTVRYVAGLSNLDKTDSGNNIHNNVFQAGLAYKF